MVEGQGSKTFSKAKSFLYREPELAHLLLNKITETTIKYLKLQIKAGADLVQVFDSWAGILSPEYYNEFGLKYLKLFVIQFVKYLKLFLVKELFLLLKNENLNCDTIGLDWTMNIENATQIFNNKNLTRQFRPRCVLYGDFNLVKKKTKEMLYKFENYRHIANLGHGVYPDTDPEKGKVLYRNCKII